MNVRYVVGIDEAGRGPLAGPVSVGAVLAPVNLHIEHALFSHGVRDSKKLTEGKRQELFAWIRKHEHIVHHVSMVGPQYIDREGIVSAITTAVSRALMHIVPKECSPEEILVLLDGGLSAPAQFVQQTTIIKGDEKEPLIALASVVAKVSRDKKMCLLGTEYPEYGFDRHKGYGTKDHYKAIVQYGVCDSHRKSFLTRLHQ